MVEKNIEIYLEPEEDILKNSNEIMRESESMEKESYIVYYTPGEKEKLVTEIIKIGCVIRGQIDINCSLVVLMTKSQVYAIKKLGCIERVKVNSSSDGTYENIAFKMADLLK